MITAIRVLKEVMCSTGSPLPSKEDRDSDLKPSGTSVFQISANSGCGYGSSRSPWCESSLSWCYCCWMVSTDACSASFCSSNWVIWVLIVAASSGVAMAMREFGFLNHDEGRDLRFFLLVWFSKSRLGLRIRVLGYGFPNHNLQIRNVVNDSFTSSHRRRQLYLQKYNDHN